MKQKNKKRQITLVIIISIVLIFFLSGFSMGKGFSKTKIQGNTEIAEPILEVESDKKVEITKTTDKGIYTFQVKNYNAEGKTTQVDLQYYIEILSPIHKNISLKIYRGEEELEVHENKTNTFLLTANQQKEDTYRIEISYKQNVPIEEIMQEIQIKVHSEQKG